MLIVAGLLGSVTEVQLCDVSGCRPTGEISLLLLGVVIFSVGMLAFSSVLERQRLGSGAAAPMWLIRSAYWASFLGFIEMCVAAIALAALIAAHAGEPGARLIISLSE